MTSLYLKISIAFLYIFSFSLINAQIITVKDKKYGLLNAQTGEVYLEQKYDSIYQLKYDYHSVYSRASYEKASSASCLFACVINNQNRIFNSNELILYETNFDEIINDMEATPSFILRKGKKFGFIACNMSYEPHKVKIIEPQYDKLKRERELVKLESTRKGGEIMVALKDSLWGALNFESGDVVVPFKYKAPIRSYIEYNLNVWEASYDRQKSNYFPYYVASNIIYYGYNEYGYKFDYYTINDTDETCIINVKNSDVSFYFGNEKIDTESYKYIRHKNGNNYIIIKSYSLNKEKVSIWNYDTGELAFKYEVAPSTQLDYYLSPDVPIFEISETKEKEGSKKKHALKVVWLNIENGNEILFYEKEYNSIYPDTFYLKKENQSIIVYKESEVVGKVIGENSNLKIEWKNKIYER
jgi:hypothetical protein